MKVLYIFFKKLEVSIFLRRYKKHLYGFTKNRKPNKNAEKNGKNDCRHNSKKNKAGMAPAYVATTQESSTPLFS
jgi:hypothetical protein